MAACSGSVVFSQPVACPDQNESAPTAYAPARGEPSNLEDLMERYQRADREAAAALVRELSPRLLRYLAGPMRTRTFAQDMLQDCWLRIHSSRHTYRPGSPVLPWVYAIARYTRVDAYHRRRQVDSNEVPTDYVASLAGAGPSVSKPPEIELWRLVDRLPTSQKEVIVMLKISGMTLEEVANATGSTVGSVKQKAHRAYENLRSALRCGTRRAANRVVQKRVQHTK